MSKAMAIGGMVIAALMTLLFGLDLATGIPFGRANVAMDSGFVVCGLALTYLSWNAFRDIRG